MNQGTSVHGKFVWFEHVSTEPKKAQRFYGEVFGWKVEPFPMGEFTYEMVKAGDTMAGGYATPHRKQPAHWISYISVEDVDEVAKAAAGAGGRVVEVPHDIPNVGRTARIADPQGAQICPFRSASRDGGDDCAAVGPFCWCELHTTDVEGALAFYEKVLGLQHRDMDARGGEKYRILSRGGKDRGGATHHLRPGTSPHWLPYVCVESADGAMARAKRSGGQVPWGPEEVPGVGRLGVLVDPTGAAIAIIQPKMDKPE